MTEAIKGWADPQRISSTIPVYINGLRSGRRSHSGQAIAEGAAMMWVIVTVAVLLIMFGINVYTIVQTHLKLQMIAYEAAKLKGASQYWLGMERSNSPANDPAAQAALDQQLIHIAQTYGIKLDPRAFSFSEGAYTTTCVIDLDKLTLPYGTGVFASFNNQPHRVAAEVAIEAKAPPTAVGVVTFADPHSNQARALYMPLYGCATISGGSWHAPSSNVPYVNNLMPAWSGTIPLVGGTALAAGPVTNNGSLFGAKLLTSTPQGVSMSPGVAQPGTPWN